MSSPAYVTDGYCFPVPTRRADYAPLFPEHAELGVEARMDAIRPFGIDQAEPDDLLYSDMQAPAWGGPALRLGAGRAGFYRGHYLKGVGKTPLAGNWALPKDWYHGTGHMFPTAAMRELLATAYLEARGLGALIVPCQGILLRPLEPRLRADLERALGPNFARLAPVDRAFQAISVKPASFARLSNFLWVLTRMYGRAREWESVALSLERHARGGSALAASACSPESIGAALAGAAERTIGSFRRHFAVGVSWQSIWNNMTLDGRFLDLEVPYLAGRAFVGAVEPFDLVEGATDTDRPAMLAGLESLEAAIEQKIGLTRLADRVRSLRELPVRWHPVEARFMDALAASIGEVATRASLFDEAALVDPIVDQLAALPHAPGGLREVVRAHYACRQEAYFQPRLDGIALERAPVTFHRIEPLVSEALWLPPGAYRPEDWEDAEFMNEEFRRVEASSDLDRTLAELRSSRERIFARWRVDAPGEA